MTTSETHIGTPPRHDRPRKRLRRSWLVAGLLALALAGAMMVVMVILLAAIMGSVRHTWAYEAGLDFARSSPSVTRSLGEPIAAGWLVRGTVDASGPVGRARLTIPLRGPDGSGTLFVEASRFEDGWRLTRAEFSPAGEDEWIDLIDERDGLIFVGNTMVDGSGAAAA